MSEYDKDREWSDRFIPAIKRIVGPMLLQAAPELEDQKHATDLMVFVARDLRIAARVRRFGYADTYPWDFTIRHSRPTGAQTEWEKIVNGFGDWMFYGHSNNQQNDIQRWMIIDLKRTRAALVFSETRRKIKIEHRTNSDGTTFLVFDARSLPPECIVDSSQPIPFYSREYA